MKPVLLMGAMALLSSPADAADRLCDRVQAFTATGFPADAQSQRRRWVELHWRGHWMDFDGGWGLSCLHSPDEVAGGFCRWLTANTSFEFPAMLPKAILHCYGYVFPDADSWSDWKAMIGLDRDTQFSLLEVNFESFATETGAIRFSTFRKGHDPATVALPPLQPMPGLLQR